MRKVTFGVANSLDNYIARNDGGVDWLLWSDDVTEFMKTYWKTIDTVVMGRKSFEAALKLGQGGGAYPGVTTYVCSRTWKSSPSPDVALVTQDAADFVRDLKSKDGKDICVMGGGDLARSLFEAGVIDEVGVNIHPVLLGSGIPLFFEMNRSIDLELIECRPIQRGCVILTYRVKN